MGPRPHAFELPVIGREEIGKRNSPEWPLATRELSRRT